MVLYRDNDILFNRIKLTMNIIYQYSTWPQNYIQKILFVYYYYYYHRYKTLSAEVITH